MKILFTIPAFVLLCLQGTAQGVFQSIKAEIIYLDDYSNKFGNQIQLGDTITGTLSYSQNALDNNADPTEGDYWYYSPPYGMVLNVGGITFQTDNTNVSFLCEVVNRPAVEDGDVVAFRSYNNYFSVGDAATDKVIAWQLDNPDGTNLNSDLVPVILNLSLWTQIFALTINADDFPDGSNGYFIRAHVFEINGEIGTGLHALTSGDQHGIFPNPANSAFTITGSLPNTLLIEDVNGKVMMSKTPAIPEVNISDFAPGIYIVKIIGEKSTKVFKLIKS